MTNPAPASRDPANQGLIGAFRVAFDAVLQEFHTMLPARVVAYSRASNRAQVQPLISIVTTTGETQVRAQIMRVPVLQFAGGGMMMSFNLVPGDLGWIKANDRDISIFNQNYDLAQPNTKRLHSFEDAMFVPDVMTGYTIAAEDQENAVFQTKDGSVCIALWPAQLKITAPNSCVTDTKAYAPHASAVLDTQSTTRAFKVPRMTHGQRDAIPSPIGGMIVYVTDFPPGFSFYSDPTGWS